jgi:hypothetical protein
MVKGGSTDSAKKAAPVAKKTDKVGKKAGGKSERKIGVYHHKAAAAGPAKPVAERGVEDWVSVGLQSTSGGDKKLVQEKALKDWLLTNCPLYQGEEGRKLVKRQVPKLLVKLLGEQHLTQYKGKWRVSQRGLVKYGDITVRK